MKRDVVRADFHLARAHGPGSEGQSKYHYIKALFSHGKLLHSGSLGAKRKAKGLELIEAAAKRGHVGAREYLKANR